MKKNKYRLVNFRVTEEEKQILENASFMKCMPISDLIREGLKHVLQDDSAFTTQQEEREKKWKI